MNRHTYGIILQLVTLVVVLCCAYFLFQTTSYNLAKAQITTGFDFLSQPSGFDIGFSFIPYDSSDTYLRVFVVGALNTLFVSVLSIFFCTIRSTTAVIKLMMTISPEIFQLIVL